MNRAGGQLVPGVSTPPTMQHRTGDSWRLKFDLPPVRHGQKTNHDMEDMIGGCIYIGSRGCLREANLFARIVNWRIALSQSHCSVTVALQCNRLLGLLSVERGMSIYTCNIYNIHMYSKMASSLHQQHAWHPQRPLALQSQDLQWYS